MLLLSLYPLFCLFCFLVGKIDSVKRDVLNILNRFIQVRIY